MTATVSGPRAPADPHDVRRTLAVPAAVAPFDAAGLLTPADVHTATTLARLVGDRDDDVLLAAALTVRATRLGHVCIDVATVAGTVVADTDGEVETAALAWPDPERWLAALPASPLVTTPATLGDGPLVLAGPRLYLDRYYRYEQVVAADLAARAGRDVPGIDLEVLRRGLARLFPPPAGGAGERPDRQRLAAATAVLRRLTVIAGGPGTGKTTTVAGILALLHDQARAAGAGRSPRVALAAPTGKAAARLTAALHDAAGRLDVDAAAGDTLRAGEASTLHRLLGMRPGSVRSRHHRDDPLPHDVVVVDETSMVSLSLVARLLEAVRRDARLVLLGDPEQLASVEAGTVLGDVVGPVRDTLRLSGEARRVLADVTGEAPADLDRIVADGRGGAGRLGDGIVVLRRVHRFGEQSGIARLAETVRRGDATATRAVLDGGHADVTWVDVPDPADHDRLPPVHDAVVAAGSRLVGAAGAGDADAALAAVDEVRVLCAHRRGPYGVATWIPRVERWLVHADIGLDLRDRWYVGRPVLVTRNDHRLGIFNGDVGVTVADGDGVAVAFEGPDAPRRLHPGRLEAVQTVHAMTVHRSQGSQFRHVVVVLPDADSPILTRELLYTAVTRGQEHVTVVGSADAVTAAVTRPIARASGLRDALWPDGP